MSGTDLRYQSTRLSALKTNVDVSSSGIALHQGELETSAQGRVKFDAAVGLSNWSYTPQSPINLRATADHLPVADVQRLAGLEYPVTGNLSVNVSLQGSQTNPAGQGSVRLVQARAWEQPIQDLSIQFQAADNTLHSTLNLHTPAGSGSVKMTYSMKDQAYDAQVDLPGIHLDQLQPVQARNLELTGVVKVSAQGRGTVKEPQLEATVEAPNLQIRQQKLDGLKIQASISRQRATFSVDSNVVGAYVQARGTVNLDSDYTANVNIDTRAIELGPLLATYLSVGPDVRGQTELHGWLKGPLKRPEKLEAHVEIPRLNLGYQSVQIANVTPLQIDYRGGTLALNRAELKGAGTDLQIEATVPVVSGGSLTATATGNVDLHILQVMNPQFESSGSIKLDVGAQGTRNHPDIHGQVRVIDAAFQAPGAPLGAEKVNAEFDFQGGRINISNFTAQSGGGTVTAQGFATYQPSVGFQVMLSARHVRLRYPEGVREVLDSDLTLNGTTESAALNGQVLIDGLSFTPSFNLSTFADQFSGTSSPPGAGFAQNVNLNVALKSAQEMSLASSQLSVQGSANLVVRGTLAEPVLLGRTQITGGELFFNNLRFQVDHGTIQFANPVSTEAVLNILVTTSAGGFNISVNLVGPLDRLRTTYTSDPPLAQVDIISLLFTGQTTEAAAANPSTPQSVLAGQMAGQVSSRLGKMAGISSLTIDPQIGGNQSNPGGSIGIQQRVTKNLFFTFTIDLTNTQGEVVQVEYQITPKYAVSAVATQNAGYSLEVKMHKKF
jgi:translocation and assembly module TamB